MGKLSTWDSVKTAYFKLKLAGRQHFKLRCKHDFDWSTHSGNCFFGFRTAHILKVSNVDHDEYEIDDYNSDCTTFHGSYIVTLQDIVTQLLNGNVKLY